MRTLFGGVFLYFSLFSQLVSGQILEGLVQLDKKSFDKILNKFDYSLVKFDVGYPTGEKHKNFGSLAIEVAGISDVFVGEVRIKDYGDKANQDLAERFSISQDKKNLPETVLFKNQGDGTLSEMVRYGGDYSIDNLRTFLSSKTGVYIKCDGCIKELDVLADKFARAATKEDRERILFAAESWAKEEGGEGDVYVKIMKASIENGKEGVLKEIKRVDKMMEEKSSNKVKEKLTRKRNVLNSFKVRDEL